MSELQNLEELDLSHCRLSDSRVSAFPHLPRLTLLNISCNQIGNDTLQVISRAGLESLSHLFAQRVDATDECVGSLLQFPMLRSVFLDETRITGTELSRLQELQHIALLSIADTRLSNTNVNTEISALSKLRHLDISGNRLSSKSASGLCKLQGLETLYIGRTSLLKAEIAEIKRLLPKCNTSTSPARIMHRENTVSGGWIRE